MTATIRPERAGDAAAIAGVTRAAFAPVPYSDGSEVGIVERLRADGDLALSLVVVADAAVVGHIAFSPVTISDGSRGWFGLGPVSVLPERQGAGLGAALVRAGLAELHARGVAGCVLLGDPAYYARFGFVADPALVYPAAPAPYFQTRLLLGPPARGTVTYAPAFG